MLFPDGIPQKDKFNFAWIGLAYKKVLEKNSYQHLWSRIYHNYQAQTSGFLSF